ILARSEDGHAGGSMETGGGCDGGAPDRVTVFMCGERGAIMLLVVRPCVRCARRSKSAGAAKFGHKCKPALQGGRALLARARSPLEEEFEIEGRRRASCAGPEAFVRSVRQDLRGNQNAR